MRVRFAVLEKQLGFISCRGQSIGHAGLLIKRPHSRLGTWPCSPYVDSHRLTGLGDQWGRYVVPEQTARAVLDHQRMR